MKKGFTIIEVSILFVIFLIVAFLVAPLSLDDTMQAKNTLRWKNVQQDFINISHIINNQEEETSEPFAVIFDSIFKNEIKEEIKPYKITFMNGTYPSNKYRFNEFKTTYANATVAFKLLEQDGEEIRGVLLYDVNGKVGPNTWGKDVFGLNIYSDHFEPFGASEPVNKQKEDCSKSGTGLFCSNYYLIGGNFD